MQGQSTEVRTANLGFSPIGAHRELKWATEAFWQGKHDAASLLRIAADLRSHNWQTQADAGLNFIPSNEFSLYDQMLDMSIMLGAIPKRYDWTSGPVSLETSFAMARGHHDIPAMEMTKWFDTNYHYVVPELEKHQEFALTTNRAVEMYLEALKLGITTRPVLIGPLTYLLLSRYAGSHIVDLLPALLNVYGQILRELAEAGVEWLQIDEPILSTDLQPGHQQAFADAYTFLVNAAPSLKLMLTNYFGDLGDNLRLACNLPVAGLHLDLVRAPEELEHVLASLPSESVLSLGLIDGRNIWRADLDQAQNHIATAVRALGKQRVILAPSCSLLHVPLDLEQETAIDPEFRSWLAFGRQKIHEVQALALAANGHASEDVFTSARDALQARRQSPRIHRASTGLNAQSESHNGFHREPYAQRVALQHQALQLPLFPTTTIGSLPQTPEVREHRANFRSGKINAQEYGEFVRAQTASAIRWQEEVGLDVIVHGEFERNDMVEYFGEKLEGFLTTKQGWVKSYGTRYVKPPIILGDIVRTHPMTVELSAYAQSLTQRPVKGMLTGPMTILQWSFVRNDQPRQDTAMQLASVLRDEVRDLEQAGLKIIQIDEPALREGLPLRESERAAYLRWATAAFRLAASGASSQTQIHTHMCYAEFDDIMEAIAALDADVISIETARSHMAILESFARFAYQNQVGPGVYDIHSPNIPHRQSITTLLERALSVMQADQLWVNPDCGLKTRNWEEVKSAIAAMVDAAKILRKTHQPQPVVTG